jgi:tetratricopeptide (TPR) repeat protein
MELTDIPFYPEKDHSYGPAALATVLTASEASATPAELISLLNSQREPLWAALRELPPRYERLAYPLAPDLSSILVELASHHPVLVRQSRGRSLLSEGHFAVVIGYDSRADTLLLRSGTTRRQVLSARNFMLAWTNADRWAMLVLRPGELPAAASREHYLQAATEFEHDARPQDSLLAFDAALRRWPDEPLAWMGRAISLEQAGERMEAARDFETSLRIDGSNSLARNGLAMTLLDLGCVQEAQDQIDKVREYVLPDPLRTTIESSRDRISARSQTPVLQEPTVCAQLAR